MLHIFVIILCLLMTFNLPVFGVLSPSKSNEDPCTEDEAEATNSTAPIVGEIPSAEDLNNLANQFFLQGELENAYQCYSNAIKTSPLEAKYHRNRAVCSERLSQISSAKEDYEKSLTLESNNLKARFSLGNLLYNMGKFEEAAGHLQKVLADEQHHRPSDIHSLLKLAQEKFENDLLEEVTQNIFSSRPTPIDVLDDASSSMNIRYPSTKNLMTTRYLAYLGNGLFREGKFEEASRYYDKAIKFNSSAAEFYKNRGFCSDRMEKLNSAMEDYKKSLDLEPNNFRVHFLLGRVYYKSERFDEASEHLKKAIEYGFDTYLTRDDIDQILSMIDINRPHKNTLQNSLESVDKPVKNDLCLEGKADDAIPSTTSDAQPFTAADFVTFGNRNYRDCEFEKARHCYDKAIQIDPQKAKYHRNRGLCYDRLQKLDLAIADYEKSLELEPSDPKGHFLLGRSLFELDLFDEAVKHLQEGLDHVEDMAPDETRQILFMLTFARQKIEDMFDITIFVTDENKLFLILKLLYNVEP